VQIGQDFFAEETRSLHFLLPEFQETPSELKGAGNDDTGGVCDPRHPGLHLDLLGLVVEFGRVRIVADRAGLLGGLLASLTCGGAAAADRLEAMAQMIRAQEGTAREGGHPETDPATPP
jgi:hypothetical protein